MDPITLGLTFIFLIATAIGLFRGLRNEALRQTVRCASTLVAILLAFTVTKIISNSIIDTFGTEGLVEILVAIRDQGGASLEAFDIVELANYLSAVKWLVALPVSTLIMPVVFVLVFILCNIIAKIIFGVVRGGLGDADGDPVKMIIGALLGAVEGFLIAAILLMPVTNTLDVFDDGVSVIEECSIDGSEDFIDSYNETVNPIADSFLVRASSFMTRPVTNGLASMKMDGERVNLRKELGETVSVYFEIASLDNATEKITEHDKEILHSVTDRITDSHYLSGVVSAMLRDSSNFIEDGLAGVDKDVNKPAFALHGVAEVFINADRDNVGIIFDTLLDALFYISDQDLIKVFSDTGAFGDEVSMLDENGENKITVVTSILNKCEYTRPLVTTISKLMLSVVFNNYTTELGDIGVTYDDVKDSFNQVVSVQRDGYDTEEEYKAARQEALNQVFVDHGVDNADPEVLADICDYLDEEYPDIDSVDDEQFNDLIMSGISYYTEKKESGDIPEIPELEGDTTEPESETPNNSAE